MAARSAGMNMGSVSRGKKASRNRVLSDMAEKRVPMVAKPRVPSKMGRMRRGSACAICRLRKMTRVGKMSAWSMSMVRVLPSILPRKIAPGSAGVRRNPIRQSFCFSMAKDRLRPSSPAKAVAIQKIPGATVFMIGDPGSYIKLKMITISNAKKAMALRRSLVRHSVLRSFWRMARVCVRKMGIFYSVVLFS